MEISSSFFLWPNSGGDDVDVGCGNAFGGAEEEAGTDVEMVNNVINAFQYTETQIGEKSDLKEW